MCETLFLLKLKDKLAYLFYIQTWYF